jgi:hypothetical protein
MERTPRRAMMKPTSEAAQRWAEELRLEMEQWPGVAVKRAFGMVLVYRGEIVFAALPGTRALYEEDALLIKFARETPALAKRMAAEWRFTPGTMQQRGDSAKNKKGEGRKWRIYVLREERDARDAVEWLARAYEVAGKRA